jgi:hypothetical protein
MLAILDRVHQETVVLAGNLDQVIQDGRIVFEKVDWFISGYSVLQAIGYSLGKPGLLVREILGIGREAYIQEPKVIDTMFLGYPSCRDGIQMHTLARDEDHDPGLLECLDTTGDHYKAISVTIYKVIKLNETTSSAMTSSGR